MWKGLEELGVGGNANNWKSSINPDLIDGGGTGDGKTLGGIIKIRWIGLATGCQGKKRRLTDCIALHFIWSLAQISEIVYKCDALEHRLITTGCLAHMPWITVSLL